MKENMNNCDAYTEEEIIKKYIHTTNQIRLQYADSTFCDGCEFLNKDKYKVRRCSLHNTHIKDEDPVICGFKRCMDGSNPYLPPQPGTRESTPDSSEEAQPPEDIEKWLTDVSSFEYH